MEDFGGAHCEFSGCNALDFLPFKCPSCAKSLCLAHSSSNMHNCSGVRRDATSLDCPVCGKSVVFNRGEDENAAWEQHYVTACTQRAAKATETVTCALPACRTALKESNRVSCSRCHSIFCLTHRIPEEHACAGLRGNRDAFLSKLAATDAPKKPTPVAKKPALKSQASRRAGGPPAAARAAAATAATVVMLECPFCARRGWTSAADLEGHVSQEHAESSSGPAVQQQQQPGAEPSSTTSTSAPDTAREVCPVCQGRFVDPIALVAHFETAHGGGVGGPGGGGRGGNRPKGEKCSIA